MANRSATIPSSSGGGLSLLLALLMVMTTLAGLASVSGQSGTESYLGVLDTQVNPDNGHTYHLLESGTWTDSASVALDLGGNLVTVNDASENDWLLTTFSEPDARHLWIGLALMEDGEWQWENGEETWWDAWGDEQPSEDAGENYAHIVGETMGSLDVGTWNNIDDDPDYFSIHAVVEISAPANHLLLFDGEDDWVEIHDVSGLNVTDELTISAWIKPEHTEGIQTIVMKGDHGWGLELIGDKVAFANGYSISGHVVGNTSVSAEEWSHIGVSVKDGESVLFSVNGVEEEYSSADDAVIDEGNFGSNECVGDPYDCNQLVIGRHGMGFDGNYFTGIIEGVSIHETAYDGNNLTVAMNISDENSSTMVSHWGFDEGYGAWTWDSIVVNRSGYLHGEPIWLEPDETPVTMAIPLENGVTLEHIDLGEGEEILFYVDIPEFTSSLSVEVMGTRGNSNPNLFLGHGMVPTSEEFDEQGFGWGPYEGVYLSWPDDGRWYILLIAEESSENYRITATWQIVSPPPTLDEMVELHNGIPVSGLSANAEDSLFFYVNVTEELHSLRIETYGGHGDADLFMQFGSVPPNSENGEIWIDDQIDGIPGGTTGSSAGSYQIDWDTYVSSEGGWTDEEVRAISPEQGIWYIQLYAWDDFSGVSIRADFEYPPVNVDPESAVELFDGVENGPWDSTDDSHDYHFFIDVPEGTEFLTVDIEGELGNADLYLNHASFATRANADHSTAGEWGVFDSITINNPAAGEWYILLSNDESYREVFIEASFEDGNTWIGPDNRVELYNDVTIYSLEAEDRALLFFVSIPSGMETLTVSTMGGSGSLFLELYADDWSNSQSSSGIGTQSSLTMDHPTPGIYNIDIYGSDWARGFSITAHWDDGSDGPGDVTQPDPEPEWDTCDETAVGFFRELDLNGGGSISEDEFSNLLSMGVDVPTFAEADFNEDGELEYTEIENIACSCNFELRISREQLLGDTYEVSEDDFNSFPWKNEFNFDEFDIDGNGALDASEWNTAQNQCLTTWSSFDWDGDGVLNEDDAFPEDPTEDKDSDGDGVGDNSDFISGVNDDLAYASAALLGLLLIILVPILLLLLRKEPEIGMEVHEADKASAITSAQLAAADSAATSSALDVPAGPEVPGMMTVADLGIPTSSEVTTAATVTVGGVGADSTPVEEVDVSDLIGDLSESEQPVEGWFNPKPTSPDKSIMGALGADGKETLVWPTGTENNWTRDGFDEEWRQA